MKLENTAALTTVIVIWSLLQMIYMQHIRTSFDIKKEHYEQIGVMQYNNDGDELYFPVYRRTIRK